MFFKIFKFITFPNFLTVIRIILIPFFIISFLQGNGVGYFSSFIIAAWIEISDMLDGHIARHDNNVSKFGKLFDPLADSLSRFSIFLTFLVSGLLPFWMIFVFFIRDMSIAYIRAFAANEGFVMGARKSGKVKAVFQAITILSVCLILTISKQDDFLNCSVNKNILNITMLTNLVIILSIIFIFKITGFIRTLLLTLFSIICFVLIFISNVKIEINMFLNDNILIYTLFLMATIITAYSLIDYTIGIFGMIKDDKK